jgi:hypothetical protein
MSTPADAIMARGQSLRRSRRIPALAAGFAAVVLGLALGIPAVTSGTNPVSATLAAWTVTREPSGVVLVTVGQLSDPAGLQHTLRADGIPVSVGFYPKADLNPPLPSSCQGVSISDEADTQLQSKIMVPIAVSQVRSASFGIRPAAIPQGIGLYLTVYSSPDGWGWGTALVHVSPGCTG